jgi:Cu2+-exporting ATPase
LLFATDVDDPPRVEACEHCGGTLPPTAADGFCCTGCRLVHSLLREEHLERYYALRGPKGDPVGESTSGRDHKWLEPHEAELSRAEGILRLDLDVQGLSCAACVWLIEQLFRREPGAASILVNPALGRICLSVSRDFPLRRFVSRVESCGYLLGPRLKREESQVSGLLVRTGICIAIAMNGMILAVSLYAGLDRDTGSLPRLFHALSFGLATVSVLVGGSHFFRTAIVGLRRGVLHLDLPIALGILLAYASSTWAWLAHGLTTYFDTLEVFIALMLVGRFLQQRVIERNKRRLLQSDGIEGLFTRRLEGDTVALVRAVEIREGDRLVLAPGDVVPVVAALEGETSASFSLDWINGESAPRAFAAGAEIPAGAFLAGTRTQLARALADFKASTLVDLLRAPLGDERDASQGTAFWRRFARIYVAAVLALAAGALLVGMLVAHDGRSALERVTAVLIVTCPCAFGIAAPLAYEIVQARLRRNGLFVRSQGFLDRAAAVRTVVFDKTGTLTTGKLRVVDASPADALAEDERRILMNLAARSPHPKSAALSRALGAGGFLMDLDACEVAGRGVEALHEGRCYRLGSATWIDEASEASEGDIAFGMDGRILCRFRTAEDLRPDAASEVRALRDAGYEVWILSGDAPERVARVAAACGIPRERAIGGTSAAGKAEWVRARDRGDILFLGDGLNDALVADVATVSGTPAIDRPFLAARSDFYLITAGIAPVRLALDSARRLRKVLGSTLGVALAYNALTVGLAYAGLMSPLLCAVIMPLSSLSTIFAVLVALGDPSRAPRGSANPTLPAAPEARLQAA